jgi:hypothetical protein
MRSQPIDRVGNGVEIQPIEVCNNIEKEPIKVGNFLSPPSSPSSLFEISSIIVHLWLQEPIEVGMPSDEPSNRHQYRTKIESYYTSSFACRMWQGLQTITDYKGKHSRELPSDTSLPDERNYFYSILLLFSRQATLKHA